MNSWKFKATNKNPEITASNSMTVFIGISVQARRQNDWATFTVLKRTLAS